MKIKSIYLLFLLACFTVGCKSVLDKDKLDGISPDEVWNSESLADAYLNHIYAQVMPQWPDGAGMDCDEAASDSLNMPDILRGTATIDAKNVWPYDRIRDVNKLLEEVDGGTCSEEFKKTLKAQALFFRGWMYFSMVKTYGGVPLMLKTIPASDYEAAFIPRNKSSECIEQIVKDLDEAVVLMGDKKWDDKNWGRIDKGAILAFKGRVLLFWASPLFNPQSDKVRWEAAYKANKEAVDYLVSQGKGLYADFGDIWAVDKNSEVIMSRRFSAPDAKFSQAGIRPLIYSKDNWGVDNPTLNLVNSFPMRDGSEYDPQKTSYAQLYKDRDDRFYATVAYNGAEPYLKEMKDLNIRMWTYRFPNGTYADGLNSGGDIVTLINRAGFYRIKGLDPDIMKSTVHDADVDWIEIRFAEVLMNMGEAANKIGMSDVALDVLKQIRKRANITPGADNNYGIKASSEDEIAEAYFNERFVEFAFEGKRWDDLRRLRKFDYLRSLEKRKGLRLNLIEGAPHPTGMDDPDDFVDSFVPQVVNVDSETIKVKDSYYFYAIPKTHLDQNSKLEQNIGWDNGSFDPLQ